MGEFFAMGSQGPGAQRLMRRDARWWVFPGWLAVFYTAWLTVVVFGGHWGAFREHWPIGVAMALGSYFAGSTPMGGGTIGFPVLVLLLDGPASLGRDFSFAIQSVGMLSASVLILSRRAPIARRMLAWAMLGATVGTPLGLVLVAPAVPELYVKLIFAVAWASFGLLHFAKVRDIARMHHTAGGSARFDRISGALVGVLAGATVAATTGVGIDLCIYVVLALVCRTDLRVSIPTSVVLMAYTSLLGIATQTLLAQTLPQRFALSDGLLQNWLVAAPVVAVGAPFGVVVVRLIPRAFTLLIVSALCVLQYAWTLWSQRAELSTATIAGSVAALLALNLAFMLLYDWGKRREARSAVAHAPDAPTP